MCKFNALYSTVISNIDVTGLLYLFVNMQDHKTKTIKPGHDIISVWL